MVLASLNTVIAGTGIVLAASVTIHHLYHVLQGDEGLLHGSIAGYYQVIAPYVLASGLVAIGFFAESFLPRGTLMNIFGQTYLVDVAFLGLTLVWLGTAYRLFSTVDGLAETYFSGDGDGV